MTARPPSPTSQVCAQCGERVPTEGAWCPSCGNKLERPDPEPPADPPASDATRPTEPSSGPMSEAFGDKPKEERPRAPKGTIIDNKYEIMTVLGEGGMGIVYLAQDTFTGVEVVLKAVRPELAHRKEILARTLGEGRTLARIDHPNVVHLNAVVHDATGLWLVMQYIQGEALNQTIRRHKDEGKTLAFKRVIDIFRQILLGVGAAHSEGIIHRDIKPANILLRAKDGVVKVTDFGIAKPEEQAKIGQGNTKGVLGSLWYMAPEAVQGQRDLDKRLDIYALGVLFYELLTGHVPFNAGSSYELMRLHVEAPFPKVATERKDVPAWVDEVLALACAKNRDERFANTDDFLAAIDVHGEGPPPGTQRKPSPLDTSRTSVSPTQSDAVTSAGSALREGPRSSRLWIILAVAAVVAASGAWLVWRFVLYQPPAPKKKAVATASATTTATTTTTTTTVTSAPLASTTPAPTASDPPPPADPLAELAGSWKSEAGTEFEAVRVGETVEFRVVDPAQFPRTDYTKGEPRFTLRRGADESTFFVEEKIRPQANLPFDPSSRTSCQEIRTSVDGNPLVASLVSERELRVDFAKVAIGEENLRIEGGKIIGCAKLNAAPRGRGRSVLKKKD